MAKKQTKITKEETLETILFNCRNSLRGRAAMTDKRDLLLTLVFLKFIGERFKQQKDKIRHEIVEVQGIHDEAFVEMQLSRPNQYMQDGVFFLTDETFWDKLILTAPTGMAIAFDTAIKTLDDNEPKLKNALPQQIFTKTALEPGVLKSVVDEINKIDPKKFTDHDLIGRVYEYFLQAFSINADKEEGEFYTPHSIVELIASLIEPFDGTVYDPCCGSGGMFVQATKFIEAHGGNTKAVNVYGQESEPATYRLAKMNLAIRGISYHLGDKAVSTFSDDQHKDLKFDYIMANPPFNLKKYAEYGEFETDPRWKGYGVPPASNANYAWIQHMVHHLSPTGRIGLVLANGSLTTTTGGEGDIRRRLIEADLVEGVIAMPNQLFYNVSIPVCVWFFNRQKKNPGKVLFIDAREMGMMVDRTHRELSDDLVRYDTVKKEDKLWAKLPAEECDVQRIAATFRSYEAGTLEDVKGFCKVATLEDIAAQDFVLTPGRYVGIADAEEDAEPFEEKMARLTAELGDLFAESHRLEAGIREKLAGIGFKVKEG